MWKSLFFFITILPSLILISELIFYRNSLNLQILSLSGTNLAGIIPTLLCYYYITNKNENMIMELIPFYFIILTSGNYHLCNSLNYSLNVCFMNPKIYYYLDFINSYCCISTVIVHAIKFEYNGWINKKIHNGNLKIVLNTINLLFYSIIITVQKNTYIPIFYTLSLLLILVIYFYLHCSSYIFLFNKNKLMMLLIGITLASFAFSIYLCTIILNLNTFENYWILHSYCWHLPVMISSLFLLEASIEDEEMKNLRLYNSLNVELTNFNV